MLLKEWLYHLLKTIKMTKHFSATRYLTNYTIFFVMLLFWSFRLKEFTYYIPETGRPFLWAQWLGGLQFLGTDSPQVPQSSADQSAGQTVISHAHQVPRSAVSSAHMQQTIERLRDRIQSRLSLLRQLASFGETPMFSCYLSLTDAWNGKGQ